MTIENEAAGLPAPTDSHNPDVPADASRGRNHIGAILVDATLQRRQNYSATVRPRVEALIAAWPDADTTSGFRRRLATGGLSDVISWPSPGRLAQIEDMTGVLERQGIKTVAELRDTLGNDAGRAALREELGGVRHVSPKTLDYIDVLCGIPGTPAAAAGWQPGHQ